MSGRAMCALVVLVALAGCTEPGVLSTAGNATPGVALERVVGGGNEVFRLTDSTRGITCYGPSSFRAGYGCVHTPEVRRGN